MTDKTNKEKNDEKQKGGAGEILSTVLWALGIAFVLRTFIFQPFTIPTGSMVPGLLPGDYILTSKYSVGYGKHAATPFPFPVKNGRLFERELIRGDVIVFRPEGGKVTFVKRVVGLPGDKVQMKEGRLYLNDQAVDAEVSGRYDYKNKFGKIENGELIVETLSEDRSYKVLDTQKNNALDRTSAEIVPMGYYFMLGDNRDHSGDSRVEVNADGSGGAGLVPKENIIGRAEFILLSVNDDFVLFKPWTWFNVRKDRWFKDIK